MRSQRPGLLLPLLVVSAASVAHAADPAAPSKPATPPAAATSKPAAATATTAPTPAPATTPGPAATPAPAPIRKPTPTGKTIDPAAMEALDKMGAYLRSLGSFAIEAEMETDDVLASGQKVKHVGLAQLKVRRPDRLRVDIAGDRRIQQLFYDGKTFTIYDRVANYYGSFPAPPLLAELVRTVEETYGIDMPLADLFRWGSDAKLSVPITAASDLGSSTVKGATCDHYAFRQPEVDWQLWIERGTKPLPRKLVITTMTEKMQPEHAMVMTWNLEPQMTEQTFAFVPPQGALKIDFAKAVDARAAAAPAGLPRQGRSSPQKKGPTP
jgi:hypothetical protein